jgi:putative toxin-antitoxin system antitoxin component (TIGR02293 family)
MAVQTWNPEPVPVGAASAGRTVARLLRSKDVSLQDASRRIEEGLPFRVFAELCEALRLTQAEFAALLRISESTLYRRKAAGRFEATESDRLWRYVVLYARAVEVLESAVAAVEWLHAPALALGEGAPLDVAKDGPGTERALAILGRMEHGVFG